MKHKTIDQESDNEWIYIPELKLKIQTKIHHKNKTYKECENQLSKGESIPTYDQIHWLRNSKYKNLLNLIDTLEFLKKTDGISKMEGYISRFYVYSGCDKLALYNYVPDHSDPNLGIRFIHKIN